MARQAKTVTITINGTPLQVEEGTLLVEAASRADVEIPTLCYHEDLSPRGICGICLVKVNGEYVRSCITRVQEGMEVVTSDPVIRETRRKILELILATHPDDCLKCIKHGKCELQDLAERLEVRSIPYDKYERGLPVDRTSPSIVRDMNKCIGCGRCIEVCHNVQSVGAIFFHHRGSHTIVANAAGQTMGTSVCVACGQCVVYCPVGALYEKEAVERVWEALADPEKVVVAQIAPAVRVALGEEFGMKPGELVIGKIYAALRRLGVDYVFDTNFSADLTIMEEGTEFLHRLEKGERLPLITSCSPGWIKFAETYYPDLLPHLSTCKSPQQMMGAVVKTYFAQAKGIPPSRIVSLSVMPCTAKKFEAQREEMRDSGFWDVDIVLTTRELARMIRQAGIRFDQLKEEPADPVLSSYSGAATIFGATGGVMEAALRTAYELKTGKSLPRVEFAQVRGVKGVKEAVIELNGTQIRVAVAHGLSNARKVLDRVREAKERGEPLPYHFIEVMACPGGCVGGGGQPLPSPLKKREERLMGLYAEDGALSVRKSHENPEVRALYEHFLKEPNGELPHTLLHTHYEPRDPYRLRKSPLREQVSTPE
nr:NADH-dependent [FeFe] hydrogenase, group A6 [Spirochaeta thermophila]